MHDKIDLLLLAKTNTCNISCSLQTKQLRRMKTKHKGELLHEKKSFIFHYHGRYAYHHTVSGMWKYRQQRKCRHRK